MGVDPVDTGPHALLRRCLHVPGEIVDAIVHGIRTGKSRFHNGLSPHRNAFHQHGFPNGAPRSYLLVSARTYFVRSTYEYDTRTVTPDSCLFQDVAKAKIERKLRWGSGASADRPVGALEKRTIIGEPRLGHPAGIK
jgi:hypothetical protein